MADVQATIELLKDFRTRPAAKNALIEMGDAAVEPLMGAINSRNTSVRWAAISILGELGAKNAVPELVNALKDSAVSSAAAEALAHITGQDFGEDYDEWKRWFDMESGPEKKAPQKNESALINDAVYNTRISADETANGYTMRVPIEDRAQDVFVNFKAKDFDGKELVVVYTRCGIAEQKHYAWALRQNVKMPVGHFAVADIEGHPNLLVVDILMRDGVTSAELRRSVERIAAVGDRVERSIAKEDKF